MSDTPVTYGRTEVNAIKAQLRRGEPPTCPRCEVDLVEVDPNPARDLNIFEAFCPTCRHCLFMRRDSVEPAGG